MLCHCLQIHKNFKDYIDEHALISRATMAKIESCDSSGGSHRWRLSGKEAAPAAMAALRTLEADADAAW